MEAKIRTLGKKLAYVFIVSGWLNAAYSQSGIRIEKLEDLLDYAQKHSSVQSINAKQRELAQLTLKTAVGNVLNPRIPTSVSMIDNSKQPVSFIPSEIFGGPAGTYREITMGQQYVSTLNLSPQFEILNFGNYARIQSAKINGKVVENNAQMDEKTLFEQVNAVYHNVVSYNAQIEMLIKNREIADSILVIVTHRYDQGLVRIQDLNETKINKIAIEDKIQQMEASVRQQYTVLQVLCDTNEPIEITEQLNRSSFELTASVTANSDLVVRTAALQHRFMQAELKSAKWQQLPTLSFVSNFAWQYNSNSRFFDPKANLVKSNYWGLRLNWDLPTNVNKLSAYKTAQINTHLADISQQHSHFQKNAENDQLETEYRKTISHYRNQQKLVALKQENFEKSRNQYRENILSLDKLLMAQNELILQESSLLNAKSAVLFAKSKIEINNRY